MQIKIINKVNLYKYGICNLFLIVIYFSNNYVTFTLLFLLIDIIISALIFNKNSLIGSIVYMADY